MPQSHPLVLAWIAKFGDALPAGFLCRQVMPDCWLRIHSLPLSKRYAESEAEYGEMLRRQNLVATYALGEGSQCIAFVTRFGSEIEWEFSDEVSLPGGPPEHVLSANLDGDEYQFFALPIVWRENAFNALIKAVADDSTGPLLFANLEKGAIYAPYDGGADLFFPSPETVVPARARFQPWLSDRGDGL